MTALLNGSPIALSKTYSAVGFDVIVLVVFGILITAAVSELVLTRKVPPSPAIGHYVNGFVVAYPWLAFVFAVVLGAMIAHFFVGLAPGHQAKDWLINVWERIWHQV